jgi:hypothetical protein
MDEVNCRREVLRRREERLAKGRPALRFSKVKVPVKNRRASSQPSARPKSLQLVSTALSALSQPEPEVLCHTTLLSSPLCSSHNLTPGTGHLTRASTLREQRQLRSAASVSAAKRAKTC